MGRISFATIAGVLAFVASAPSAFGQAAPPPAPPSPALPNIAPREVVNPSAPAQTEPEERVRITGGGAIAPGPCPLESSDVHMALTSVTFAGPGGSALPPELARILAGITPPAGDQPIRVVCGLRDQAQARLRAARYIASVQIPQQQITDGVLRLTVVWGRITEVRVHGDAGPYEALMRRRIDTLKKLDPLNESDAERVLLLANDIPGLTVQLALSPAGTNPGDLIGDLSIRFERFRLTGNAQNYNSAYLGRETVLLRGEFFGLTGMGDVTSVALSATTDFQEQKIAQVRHALQLDQNGDTFSLVGTYAKSQPGLDNLDLRTLSLIGGFELDHPLVRTLKNRVTVAGGFEYSMQRTRVYGDGQSFPFNRDRIAALYLRFDGSSHIFDRSDSQVAQLSGSIEVRKGLDIFGATLAPSGGYGLSRAGGSATATILRGSLNGVVDLGRTFEFYAGAQGQWSNRQLLNYDQFSIGNLTIGRGYDPGANSGDRAIGFTVEPRVNVPLGRNVLAQLFGYYDGVKLWNLDPNSTEKNRYLASVGGGVHLNLFRSIRLDVTYTHPLDPPLLTGNDVEPPADRVLVSLTVQFVPFGR